MSSKIRKCNAKGCARCVIGEVVFFFYEIALIWPTDLQIKQRSLPFRLREQQSLK